MKRIIRSVQSLSDQASRLSAAASQLPGRVAEIRESVAATAGQLQHLKSDIEFNVAELQVSSESHLAAALMEINHNAKVLEDAGFELEGVDLELSPGQRLVVHLLRIGDADDDEFRDLIQKNQSLPTIRAILASLLKARNMAATIEIGGLDYHRVLIGIGSNPVIRLSWRPPVATAAPPAFSTAFSTAPALAVEPPASSTLFGETKPFFASPAAVAPELTAEPPVQPASVAEPPPLPPVSPPPLPPSADPLARFKVMPSLGKP